MVFKRMLMVVTAILAAGFMMTGCSSQQKAADMSATDLDKELQSRQERIASLEKSVEKMESQMRDQKSALDMTERELEEARKQTTATSTGVTVGDGSALPPASVGECYAKVWVDPVYDTKTTQMLKKEASERLEVTNATYQWTEEQVLVKEASTKLEVVPATYEWVEEQMLVKPASRKVVEVPAVYETVTDKVVDTPEHTIWKKGRGAIEKLDNSTGEIVCLVKVPATYKTVSKRIVKSKATTREIEIPAEYNTVKKRVVKTPSTTREITIPAEYKMVKVRKVVEPENTKRIPIEAEYATVTSRVLVSEGKMEWRPVLCETNVTAGFVSELQRALDAKGHNPGPIDGVYGSKTRAAVIEYQKAKDLPSSGQLTLRTIESLGLSLNS